jgi:hypothetical protein
MGKGGKGNLLVLAYLFLLLNVPTAKACRVFLSPLLVGGPTGPATEAHWELQIAMLMGAM